jgi:hypothetical protein
VRRSKPAASADPPPQTSWRPWSGSSRRSTPASPCTVGEGREVEPKAGIFRVQVETSKAKGREVLRLVNLHQGSGGLVEKSPGSGVSRPAPSSSRSPPSATKILSKAALAPRSSESQAEDSEGSPRWPLWVSHGSDCGLSTTPSRAAASAIRFWVSPLATRRPSQTVTRRGGRNKLDRPPSRQVNDRARGAQMLVAAAIMTAPTR